jgi:hypothetical protein
MEASLLNILRSMLVVCLFAPVALAQFNLAARECTLSRKLLRHSCAVNAMAYRS